MISYALKWQHGSGKALDKKIWNNQTNPDEFSLGFTLSQSNYQIFYDTAKLV